jgi:hypothetical protein
MKPFFEKNSLKSILLFLVGLYLVLALEEYLIHKYVMHQKVDLPFIRDVHEEHIRHHIATNKDFTLKNEDHKNVCFTFMTIIPLFLIATSVLYIFFNTIISLPIIIFSVITAAIIHMNVWNTLHSYIHSVDVNKVCKKSLLGISKEYINEENIYVKWSVSNHRAHHSIKGDQKGNWNVVFPGLDYILGTHNTIPIEKD